jgi:TetR/AcrR family transcriptional repressor of nem operon
MPRVKTFNEQEILEKAMELFWEKGYAATSIQDLVNYLGINRASLYDTYGGKREIFKKAFSLYRDTNTQRIAMFLESQPHIKTGFRKLLNASIEQNLKDNARKGCFVVNITAELIPGDDEMQEVLSKNKESFEKIFFDYLKKGEAENQFPPGKDLKSIASLLFTIYSGLNVVSKLNSRKSALTNSVSTALSLLD